MTSNFKHEFPDFDYDVAALIAELPAGWEDRSWHNDAMPKASPDRSGFVQLWFDYRDPALSEFPEGREAETCKVFTLMSDLDDGNFSLFETDRWEEMRDWIRANEALIKSQVFECEAFEISREFTRLLKDALTGAQWKEMVRLNASDLTYANGACASHNYCDANMPMAEAFQSVTGREPDGNNEDDAALWNRAWNIARASWQEAK